MNTLDRYILRALLTGFLSLLLVVSVLFVAIDLVVDLDEYVGAMAAWSEHYGGKLPAFGMVVLSHHGPMLLMLYVKLCGVLAAGATAFTVVALQRSRELVGVVAGGVSLQRLARPVLLFGLLSSVPAWYLGEQVLPDLAYNLTRAKYELRDTPSAKGRKSFPVHLAQDQQGWLLSAADVNPREGRMTQVRLLERGPGGHVKTVVTADQALWKPTLAEGKGAWVLVQGVQVAVPLDGSKQSGPEVASFWQTPLTPAVLQTRRDASYARLLGSRDLRRLAASDAVRGDQKRYLHQLAMTRLAGPLGSILVPLVVLPFLLSREPRVQVSRALMAAVTAMGCWGVLTLMQMVPGSQPWLHAWGPVVLLGAVAWVGLRQVKT